MSEDNIETAGPSGVSEPGASYGSVLRTPSHSEIRDMLEGLVIHDLLGPAGGPDEEVTEDRVRERYLVGMLAPRRVSVQDTEIDELAVAGTDSYDEGKTDLGVAKSGTMLPSSIGMTFGVDGGAAGLRITSRWGRYLREHSETATGQDGKPPLVWKRTQIEVASTPISLKDGPFAPWVVTDEQPEVRIEGRMRKQGSDWIVTLFLVNGQNEPKKIKDEAWLFQAQLIVESADGKPVFCKRHSLVIDPTKLDPLTRMETDAMAMLYRQYVEFAVGHGVGVHAVLCPDDPQRAIRVQTETVPQYEVPMQTPPTVEDNPDLAGLVLDMKELSETADSDFAAKMGVLPDAYAKWIDRQAQRTASGADGLGPHAKAANEAIQHCREALERIRAGIALVSQNKNAAEAFRFANEAMWQQRVHSIFAKQVRKGQRKFEDGLSDIDVPQNRTWYPFQLAFVLLNLPSITDLHHPDRSHETQAVADLLWFPTGGGKTEAYLGLAAYTMALRRLQGPVEGRSGEHGVAVLMRYTLRLLTLQQFQRAATLICAMETIRQADIGKWGEAPFRIGLWVGKKATPNTTKQSQEAIASSHGGQYVGGVGTPAQLTSCPWCGTKIDPGKHIKVHSGMNTHNRTVIYCGDDLGRCTFSERHSPDEGIPALVVDEEIYRRPPSLLIATVDKFAQMPWKGTVQVLFGQVDGVCPRHGFTSPEIEDSSSHPRRGNLPAVKRTAHAPLRPPDLIIQDELHLISGPMGSMVGLYETAVDELCSWTVGGERVRPKVIASTATIRRAPDQVYKIFLRRLEVFPPHGTSIEDNFFSVQRTPCDKYPGRRYLGICAVGRRYPVATIRVYVALLAAAKKLYEQYDSLVDPWMTLTGYFNSIRELGGTRRLVDDDIRSRLRDSDKRGLAKRRPPFLRELTSRVSGTEIPAILDLLDIGFNQADDKRREAQRKANQKVDPPNPLDVVLATNMISVGVDVDRLGLMAVSGQPKTTAEYIQATSRVGRRFPGLVVTVYNWARPRDLSHYERFEHYHATFYQHVEALSVTPFAPRALDRGLSGVLVALIRLAEQELNANDKARALTRDHALMAAAIETIVRRATLVEGSNALGDEVRKMLKERRDLWLSQISKVHLGYDTRDDGITVGLLKPPGLEEWERFTCLNSLRDVEATVNLILDDGHGFDEPLAQPAASDTTGGAQ